MRLNNFAIFLKHFSDEILVMASPWYYIADPFIVSSTKDLVIIVAEKYSWLKRKGEIVRIEITYDNRGNLKAEMKSLIKEKFHLSYPCLYKVNGSTFMIPESSAVEELILYELDETCTRLLSKRILGKGHFVDPVVFSISGKDYFSWYTGTGNSDGETLYSPVNKSFFGGGAFLIDTERTSLLSVNRSGGRIFADNCRPVQSPSNQYGKGLSFDTIEHITSVSDPLPFENGLTLPKLREKLLANCHHYDSLENTYVLDCSFEHNFFKPSAGVSFLKTLLGEDVTLLKV